VFDERSADEPGDNNKRVGNDFLSRAALKKGGGVTEQRSGSEEGREVLGVRTSGVGPEVLVAMGFAWPDVLAEIGGKENWEGRVFQSAACSLAWRAGQWGEGSAGGQLSKEALEEQEALAAIFGEEAFYVQGSMWRVVVDGISGAWCATIILNDPVAVMI
jgi:hypothetical protein